jgi:D-beta-D-heptose 7-phosphate kinase/D-beta-D-heptose 1-phosphate adenosyltransferase
MGHIFSTDLALSARAALSAAGKTLVFTNGIFDLLHAGHVATLEAARALGDALYVGLNSDASARRLKGAARPLTPEEDRARVLAALACVDAVIPFDEDTAERLVAALRPEVYVKGGDYAKDEPPEARVVAAYGGRVVIVPTLPGRSTTALIQAILERYGRNT